MMCALLIDLDQRVRFAAFAFLDQLGGSPFGIECPTGLTPDLRGFGNRRRTVAPADRAWLRIAGDGDSGTHLGCLKVNGRQVVCVGERKVTGGVHQLEESVSRGNALSRTGATAGFSPRYVNSAQGPPLTNNEMRVF